MIPAPARLALLGGGQLGRFFTSAAQELGYQVTVLDPDPHSPAGRIADEHLCTGYDDEQALKQLAASCAAATMEFENVPAAVLARLSHHMPVRPSAQVVGIVQDRISEKTFLRDNGFPVAPFIVVRNEGDLDKIEDTVYPALLKVGRFGYDGKGQAKVAGYDDALRAFRNFHGEPCVLEKLMPLDLEVSVIMARGACGETRCFPVTENRHRHGILDISIAPATIAEALRHQAETIAARLAEQLAYTGVLAVEFFVCGNTLLVNELAPRPHNSGHYTLDACITHQFEQQVRALCGLPLASAAQHSNAVMVNLLGDLWFTRPSEIREPDWQQLLRIPNVKLHLYGKQQPRPGRKMGHFTIVDSDPAHALETALAARQAIGIVD